MESTALNRIECFNELFILCHSYFLLLFTDLIPDVDTRYQIGYQLLYILLGVIAIDLLLIVYILLQRTIKVVQLNRQKSKIEKALKFNLKEKVKVE